MQDVFFKYCSIFRFPGKRNVFVQTARLQIRFETSYKDRLHILIRIDDNLAKQLGHNLKFVEFNQKKSI